MEPPRVTETATDSDRKGMAIVTEVELGTVRMGVGKGPATAGPKARAPRMEMGAGSAIAVAAATAEKYRRACRQAVKRRSKCFTGSSCWSVNPN